MGTISDTANQSPPEARWDIVGAGPPVTARLDVMVHDHQGNPCLLHDPAQDRRQLADLRWAGIGLRGQPAGRVEHHNRTPRRMVSLMSWSTHSERRG